jgi:diphthine synthase
LRIAAEKRGVKTRIVHGASIISAVIGLSGLHNYKFGKTVTIPFLDNFSETPYDVIAQNKKLGLHTLCLLDLRSAENKYLTINQAIEFLQKVEEIKKTGVITSKTPALGIARAGSNNPVLRADYVDDLVNFDFGEPPFSLIIPGDLHFMEVDALIAFAGAPADFRRLTK